MVEREYEYAAGRDPHETFLRSLEGREPGVKIYQSTIDWALGEIDRWREKAIALGERIQDAEGLPQGTKESSVPDLVDAAIAERKRVVNWLLGPALEDIKRFADDEAAPAAVERVAHTIDAWIGVPAHPSLAEAEPGLTRERLAESLTNAFNVMAGQLAGYNQLREATAGFLCPDCLRARGGLSESIKPGDGPRPGEGLDRWAMRNALGAIEAGAVEAAAAVLRSALAVPGADNLNGDGK